MVCVIDLQTIRRTIQTPGLAPRRLHRLRTDRADREVVLRAKPAGGAPFGSPGPGGMANAAGIAPPQSASGSC